MKIFTKTFILCILTLIVSEFSTCQMLTTATQQSYVEKENILQYIQNIISSLFYQQKKDIAINQPEILSIIIHENNEKDFGNNTHKKNNSNKNNFIPEKEISSTKLTPLSRNEALEIIRSTTGKIFDPEDPYHISIHLDDLQKLTEHLDPVVDKKTITAIKFLVENQHKTSYLDTVFWIRNLKDKELDTSIPLTQQAFDLSKTEKLKILRTKLTAPKPELLII